MPRTSKARVFRSSQTSPNTGTARDLLTTFGTAANAATVAGFAVGGLVTSIRWSPGATATAATAIPSAGTASSGMGWRDTVGENTAEQVRYDAGTWTLRVQLTKTGQTLAADMTVRVTLVAYRVTSAGAFVAEVGRVQMADAVLSTATLTLTGSFTTAATLLFDAGDKLQVEAYVQPISVGLPAAPAAAVNVNFVVDETNAASGAAFAAIPGYQILYARTVSATGTGSTAGTTRRLTLARAGVVSGPGAAAAARRLILARAPAVTGTGTAATPRAVAFKRSAGATGTGVAALGPRRITKTPTAVSGTGIGAAARSVAAARSAAVTGTGTAGFVRALIFGRVAAATATGFLAVSVKFTVDILNRIAAGGTPDWPQNTPTKAIAGVTRSSTGAVLGGATVHLVRQVDGQRVATATSNVTTGVYAFARGGDDPYTYRVVATLAGAPETHGVTDLLVPA